MLFFSSFEIYPAPLVSNKLHLFRILRFFNRTASKPHRTTQSACSAPSDPLSPFGA
ncbi:unnamed protein product [Arabidopsis lyrata]|nr:unnamed protein product [Arabidopsis lyrata]